MAPTAEKTSEELTVARGEALFFSKTRNLRLVLAQIQQIPTPTGGVRTTSPGFTVEFENSYYRVDEKIERRFAAFRERFGAMYDDPELEDAPSLAERLRSHNLLNSTGPGGFVEIKSAIPDAGPVVMAIGMAMIDGDAEKISQILLDELPDNGGHDRPQVIEAARKALNRLDAEAPENIDRGPQPQEPEANAFEGLPEPGAPPETEFPPDEAGGLEEAVTEAEHAEQPSDQPEPTEPAREAQGDGFFGGPPGAE